MVSSAREEERESSRATISQLEQTNSSLQEQVSAAQDQCNNLSDELEVVRSTLTETREQKRAAERATEEIESQVTLLLQSLQVFSQATIASPSTVIDACTSATGEKEDDDGNPGAKSQSDTTEAGIAADATASVSAELDVLQSADFFASESVARLANLTAGSIRSALDSIASHSTALKTWCSKALAAEKEVELTKTEAATEVDDLTIELNRAKGELESEQRRQQQLQLDLESLQKSVEESSAQVVQLQTKLDMAEVRVYPNR